MDEETLGTLESKNDLRIHVPDHKQLQYLFVHREDPPYNLGDYLTNPRVPFSKGPPPQTDANCPLCSRQEFGHLKKN